MNPLPGQYKTKANYVANVNVCAQKYSTGTVYVKEGLELKVDWDFRGVCTYIISAVVSGSHAEEFEKEKFNLRDLDLAEYLGFDKPRADAHTISYKPLPVSQYLKAWLNYFKRKFSRPKK